MVWAIKVILAVLHASGCSTICSHIFFTTFGYSYGSTWCDRKFVSLFLQTFWHQHVSHQPTVNVWGLSRHRRVPKSNSDADRTEIFCWKIFLPPKKFAKSLSPSSNLDAPCFFFLFLFRSDHESGWEVSSFGFFSCFHPCKYCRLKLPEVDHDRCVRIKKSFQSNRGTTAVCPLASCGKVDSKTIGKVWRTIFCVPPKKVRAVFSVKFLVWKSETPTNHDYLYILI